MARAVVTDQRLVQLPAGEALARLPEEVSDGGVSVRIDRTRPAAGTATPSSKRFPATWQARRSRGQGYVEVGSLSSTTSLVEVGLPQGVARRHAELLRDRIEGRLAPAEPVGGARRPRPGLRWAAAGIAVALVAAAVPAVRSLTRPEPVTVEMATARYRATVAAAETDPRPAPHARVEDTTPPPPPAPVPAQAAVQEPPPPAPTPAAAEEPPPAEQPEPPAARPEPGVYRYATTGWEELSMPGSRRSFPPETAQTVTHTACGFQVAWQPLEERADAFELCVDDRRAVLASVSTYRSFFGRAHEQRFVCTEVTAPSGAEWSVRCRDDDTTMEVTARPQGRAVVDVAGQPVETLLMRMDSRLEGDTSGTRAARMWFAPDGLVVRTEVVSDLQVRGPFGNVRYREEHSLHLADPEPHR